jgi:hypothetical protein
LVSEQLHPEYLGALGNFNYGETFTGNPLVVSQKVSTLSILCWVMPPEHLSALARPDVSVKDNSALRHIFRMIGR